jgi:hypothetical protein
VVLVVIPNDDILELLTDVVKSGPGVHIPVSGRSMGPYYESVSGIIVRAVEPGKLRIGDIVVAQRDGRWVVHRVMWKVHGRFITKGDGLGQLDRPRLNQAEVRGRVAGLVLNDGTTIQLDTFKARCRGVVKVLRGWLNLWFTLS